MNTNMRKVLTSLVPVICPPDDSFAPDINDDIDIYEIIHSTSTRVLPEPGPAITQVSWPAFEMSMASS